MIRKKGVKTEYSSSSNETDNEQFNNEYQRRSYQSPRYNVQPASMNASESTNLKVKPKRNSNLPWDNLGTSISVQPGDINQNRRNSNMETEVSYTK